VIDAQVTTRTRTRTRTRIVPGQTQTITLAGGQLLQIDSRTLQRLQSQGVDINNLQNLSEAELERLGISLRTETITIPGAVQLEGGVQQIRLRNGVILAIDQQTLQRLRARGVDVNTLSDLSEAELRRLGIVLQTSTVNVTLEEGATRTITLKNGQVITIVFDTLVRLQEEGIDIDNLQALSEDDLVRLGIIERSVTIIQPVARPRTTTNTVITASLLPEEPLPAPAPVPAPAPTQRPRPRARPATPAPRPPPPPPVRDEPEDEGNAGHPAPEPYSFAYTADTEDGASTQREESQTADGVVTGFYIIKGADGSERRVDYVADQNGYRATVTTNEAGTESGNPGDAQIISSAPSASELSRQFTAEQERTRASNPDQRRAPLPVSRTQSRNQGGSGAASTAGRTNIEILRPSVRQAASSRSNAFLRTSASVAQGIKI